MKELRILRLEEPRPRIGRRGFLKGAAALALLGAAGCTTSAASARTLNFYNWPKYIGERTLSDFEKAYGIRVTYDNYSAQDTLEAKLRIGRFGYDLVVASDYKVTRFRKLGIIQPLDTSRIRNLDNVFGWLREAPFDPGNRYSVPWQWGTTGIGYNSAAVRKPVTGWGALWDAEFAGRITMLNERRECLGAGLLRCGHSVNSTDPKALREARDALLEQKPLLKHYSSDTYIDELAAEDAMLSEGWSGDVFQALADNPKITYVIPQEGSMVWVDSMVIPAGAPHKAIAETFIDYVLEPQVGADLSNAIQFATPNRAALPLVRAEDRANPLIYPPAETMKKLEFIRDLGDRERLLNDIWEQVKLGKA